jgi:Chitin synthase export chaperone
MDVSRLNVTLHQPFWIVALALFVATTYISLDTALGFSTTFKSNPPSELKNIALFVLIIVWPLLWVDVPLTETKAT